MLNNNLGFLDKKHSKLIRNLEVSIDEEKFKVIETKNGFKTVTINVEDKPILLHSKYNPQREAERLINKFDLDYLNFIIVLGFGFGYHILELFEKIKDRDIQIFVIEKDITLFKEALKYQDFSMLFKSENFHLLINEELEEYKIYDFISKNIDIVFSKFKILSLPAAIKYAPGYYKTVVEEINYLLDKIIINKATAVNEGKLWHENRLKNLNLFINNIGIDKLIDVAQDKPAIVVAAGPSLNKNIGYLKKVQGRALIICVDAALKSLLDKGIIPDVVVVLDGKKSIFKFFEGVNYDKLKDSILAAPAQIQPKIFNDWSGYIVLTCLEDHIVKWLERYTGYKGRIVIGGSVSHVGFEFALSIGADPIIFVGQDLSFSEDATHVTGAANNKDKKQHEKKTKKKLFRIKDINGDLVWTRNDFYTYLKWYNYNIKKINESNHKRKFIDATEGGVRIEGTELMTLKEVINKYCQDEDNIKEKIITKISTFEAEWDEKLILDLKNVIDDLDKIKKLAQKGLKRIDRLLASSFADFEETNKKLKEINVKIDNLKDNIIFFESDLYDIYVQKKKNSTDNIYILNQFVDFYNRLIKGSKRVSEILNENYQQLISEEDN
ncbi:motility associated factor glycosyltransferase family protein [Natroniella sp. ANB-PHB2]|uniref:motility associated factor glycosyltransferase family protein n=1 Tax=Natroniella sp. ANB-PHB2 TaxID=3384444 RepID=UPI0038D3A4A7